MNLVSSALVILPGCLPSGLPLHLTFAGCELTPTDHPPQDSLKLDLQGKDSKTHQQTPFSQLLPRDNNSFSISLQTLPCSFVPCRHTPLLKSSASRRLVTSVISFPNPPSFRVCLVSQLNKISVNSLPMSLRLSPSLGQSCQVYDTYCLLK